MPELSTPQVSARARPRRRNGVLPKVALGTRSRYETSLGTEKRSAPFLPYIHSFRAVAIIAVVASHVDLTWPQSSITGRLVLATAQDASAMFLFVAGFLFQHLSGTFGYGKYLKSKLQYVIVPYVVVSIPTMLYQYQRQLGIFGPQYRHHLDNPILNGARALLTAEHMPAPLWFVPMISILYVAAPVLLAIDRRPRLYWVIPPLLVTAMFCHRPLPVNHIGHALVYFGPAYLAGMWFSHYRGQAMAWLEAHLGALFVVYAAVEVLDILVLKRTGVIYSHLPFSTENGVLDLNLPNKLLLSLGLVGLLARFQAVVGKKLDYLAGASFGIFFIHPYCIEAADRILQRWRHRDLDGTVSNVLILIILCTLASLGVVALVRMVAGKRSRYLVGC